MATGWIVANAVASPPHMTVSAPLTAPTLPPDTGASMNCRPRSRPATASSRATAAEAVVWSTKIAPFFMPA